MPVSHRFCCFVFCYWALSLSAQPLPELIQGGKWQLALEQVRTMPTEELDVPLLLDKVALCNRLWQFEEMMAAVELADSLQQAQEEDGLLQVQLAAWKFLAATKVRRPYEVYNPPSRLEQEMRGKPRFAPAFAKLALAQGWEANYHRGQNQEAIAHYLEALARLGNTSDLMLRSELYRELGNMYRVVGDFANSIDYYQQELALYEEAFSDRNQPPVAFAHYHIASVYYELGEYQEALQHYVKAEPIWLEKGVHNPRYLRFLLEAIGDMYWYLDQNDKALQYYDRAVQKQPLVNNDESQRLTALGDSLSQVGVHAQALAHYQEALDFRLEYYGRMHPLSGGCQSYVANSLARSGFTDMAMPAFSQAIDMLTLDNGAPITGGEWYLLQALKGKADLHREAYKNSFSLADLDTCVQLSKQGLELLAKMRQKTLIDPSRQLWVEQTYPIFDFAVESALAYYEETQIVNYLESALQFSDQRKALTLMAAAQTSSAANFAGLPADKLVQERKLSAAIQNYSEKIALEEQRCQTARPAQLEVWQEKLTTLQLSYNSYLQEIREQYPDYYALKYALSEISIDEVQHWLQNQPNAAMISCFETEREWLFFLLLPDGFRYHRVQRSSELKRLLQQFITSIESSDFFLLNPSAAYQTYGESAYALYRSLLAPLLDELPQAVDRLIIIPDGVLANLPWSILLTAPPPQERDYRDLAYLFRRFASVQYPSIGLCLQTSEPATPKGIWYAFAPELSTNVLDSMQVPALSLHQPEIEAVFGSSGRRYFLDEQASESQLKSVFSKASLIHLATHTNIGALDSGQTAILLARDEEEDGFLQLSEIYGLTTEAELMVLSACSTAAGNLEMGEGLINLVRAVQYAGCHSTLASLWSLEERTASTLMPLFYEQLAQGLPKDQALQQAMLAYLDQSSPDLLAPVYWGGLQLYGTARPIASSPNSQGYLLWMGLALVLLLLMYLFWLKWPRPPQPDNHPTV